MHSEAVLTALEISTLVCETWAVLHILHFVSSSLVRLMADVQSELVAAPAVCYLYACEHTCRRRHTYKLGLDCSRRAMHLSHIR
jgi:hypothetical protein